MCDEACEYIHVENQVLLGAHKTVSAKTCFEQEDLCHGVLIKGYRGDNRVYKVLYLGNLVQQ